MASLFDAREHFVQINVRFDIVENLLAAAYVCGVRAVGADVLCACVFLKRVFDGEIAVRHYRATYLTFVVFVVGCLMDGRTFYALELVTTALDGALPR